VTKTQRPNQCGWSPSAVRLRPGMGVVGLSEHVATGHRPSGASGKGKMNGVCRVAARLPFSAGPAAI
jgi:hypothetical protein